MSTQPRNRKPRPPRDDRAAREGRAPRSPRTQNEIDGNRASKGPARNPAREVDGNRAMPKVAREADFSDIDDDIGNRAAPGERPAFLQGHYDDHDDYDHHDDDMPGNSLDYAAHEQSSVLAALRAQNGKAGGARRYTKPAQTGEANGNLTDSRRGKRGGQGRNMPELAGPERLQKVLAHGGYASRREIEEWVQAGRISINGEPAHLGQKVGPEDKVRVNGKLIQLKFRTRTPRVLIYHKPEGEIVSRDDPEGRPSVFAKLPRLNGARWIAIGRLDFNTSGLLIFTTDGELANKLMHPRQGFEREYSVRLLGTLDDAQRAKLLEGVQLEDGLAKFNSVRDGGGEGANHWYNVTVSEGRNREVRRMFEAFEITVSRLIRVRFGPVMMPARLKRGMTMDLPEQDVRALLKVSGVTDPNPRGADKRGKKHKKGGPSVVNRALAPAAPAAANPAAGDTPEREGQGAQTAKPPREGGRPRRRRNRGNRPRQQPAGATLEK